MPRFCAAAFALLLPASLLAAEPLRTVDFSLKDSSDRTWSLAGLKDSKAIVIVFLGTDCPVNNAYAPRLAELHKEFDGKGVHFLGINSNWQDTATRIAGHAKEHGIPFPVLKDTANVVADKFAARRTPEVFVLTPDGKVHYQGRIDDQYSYGGTKRPQPTRRDLAEAITEVLGGKPVSVAKTDVAGCVISRAIKAKETGTLTFTRDVARILQQRCQECHRPGQIGPMPLISYEDALGWSAMIQEVVSEKRMPPWHADPKHGTFANDRSLSDKERATLLSWIDQSCPKGDEKDMPKAPTFADGWRIGKPDAVLTIPTELTIPAKADNGIKYQYIVVPTNFEEDRWVKAAEAKPGNRAVVHHIIVFILPPGQRFQPGAGGRDREDGIGTGWLVAYAPGDNPALYADGIAKKIPKGASLVFQLHYTPNGAEATDRSSVGIIFTKEPPKHEAKTRGIANRMIIPPGADNYEVKSATTFQRDAELISLMPHMHLRGKDFSYRVVFPDGKTETLLSVPHYDFNWQSVYRLDKPLKLPAGTRIECTAHFDNSAKNANNPDPNKTVRWGDQTWDEMMIGFVDYAYTAPAPEKK
jgi:peroxiredoxin